MTVVDPSKRDTLGVPRDLTYAPPGICYWFNYTGAPLPGCTAPATRRTILGCVHEHVHEADLCDRHANAVTTLYKNKAACNPCLTADGHRCLVRLVSDTTITGPVSDTDLPVSDTRSRP